MSYLTGDFHYFLLFPLSGIIANLSGKMVIAYPSGSNDLCIII